MTYPDLVVLVVDNGSTDGSVEAIRAAHPAIELLALGRNTGFTGGNNAGLTELLGRGVNALGVLNNDTVVPPGFLEPIVAALDAHPNAFVSPRVVHLDDRYFLIFEGSDWCERARNAGASGYAVTKRTILHAVSSSFTRSSAELYQGAATRSRSSRRTGRSRSGTAATS